MYALVAFALAFSLGAGPFWVGWSSFNAGSDLEATGPAGLAFLNTIPATAVALA